MFLGKMRVNIKFIIMSFDSNKNNNNKQLIYKRVITRYFLFNYINQRMLLIVGHNQICCLATFDVTENEKYNRDNCSLLYCIYNMSYSLLRSNCLNGCLSHMAYLSLPGTRKKSATPNKQLKIALECKNKDLIMSNAG